MVKGLESSKKMHNLQGPFLQKWNKIFLLFCVIAVLLDPLFLYIPVVNRDKKCFELDKKLRITATALRSITDILCIIDIVFQFRIDFYDRSSTEFEDDVLVKKAWETAKRYLSSCFVINILAILPLPQVVLFLIIPKVKGSVGSKVKSWLIFFVVLQYLQRLFRIIPIYKKVARTTDLVSLTAWAKAVWNLILYMTASHIFGAFWYFFSIAREAACWQKACGNYIGCVGGSFFCDDNLGDNTFLNDFCPIKTPNTTLFDFGIFTDALQSGLVESTDFPGKLFSCFWWGLRNLSSLGQNLNTSNYIWETCFAVGISISGLLLLVFLIGNMQTYLQSNNVRSEEMRLNKKEMRVKVEKIDKWMTSRELSRTLRDQIKDFLQSKWQETEGFEGRILLHNLPLDLQRNLKHELCLKLLNEVPKFREMGDHMLHELCDHVKLVFHPECSHIVHGGDPIDQMLFITRGRLWAYPTSGETTAASSTQYIMKGEYYGEELIDWARTAGRSNSNLPISTKTIQAVTDVEGFALVAVDLKSVINRATRAACCIQINWRQHSRRNREFSCEILVLSQEDQSISGLPPGEPSHEVPRIHELSTEELSNGEPSIPELSLLKMSRWLPSIREPSAGELSPEKHTNGS